MIIAVVPAPGHEALLAPAPCVLPDMAFMDPERPAMLVRCEHCNRWDCIEYEHWINDRSNLPRALVLCAPGSPQLGMSRAMEAAGLRDFDQGDDRDVPVLWEGTPRHGFGPVHWKAPPCPIPSVTRGASVEQRAFALAHLLVQKGPGAEVLVLRSEHDTG